MLENFIKTTCEYGLEIIPAFLIAILISSALDEVIPERLFEKFLSKNNFFGVIIASVTGALIPLCSCGMIPLVSRLQRKGASWLISISLLTSGNACSIIAIFLTTILGLQITILRFFSSILLGILVSYAFVYVQKGYTISSQGVSIQNPVSIPDGKNKFKKIFSEFMELFCCFGPWILVSVFVAAIIKQFLCIDCIENVFFLNDFLSPFVFSITGFPFYFCAGTDIPVSQTLLSKGLPLGSVISFMLSSSSINLNNFFVCRKWLGLKNTLVYMTISFLICGIIGVLINSFLKLQ